jgi:tetratricopeptide (TPR) repeat protein
VVYTSEIEKLEKRWAENPKGRNFAPLADAYRKAGELDRALELCKAGLDLHPDYVSAHIVYARCLIEQKNDPGASDVFRKVLTLDPENVLALKMLAEIAERGGRFGEAVDWLTRLLNADPMNGDAAEALARAKARAAQSGGKSEPVVRLVPETAQTTPITPARPAVRRSPSPASLSSQPPPLTPPPPVTKQPDFVIEHVSEGPPPPKLDVKGTPTDIETFDGTLDFNAVSHGAARADGLEVQEEVQLKPQDMVVEGLAHSQYEAGMIGSVPEAATPDEELPTVDLPLIMPDEIGEPAAAPTPPRPSAASKPPPPPPPPPPPAPPPPSAPPAAVALSDDDGAADTAALSRAEPVLTETMAELYLRQGHQEDALRVYEALLAQRPGDPRLRARVQSLTGRTGWLGGGGGVGGVGGGAGATGETVQAFLKRILAGRLGARGAEGGADVRARESSDSPDPTGGSPLDSAFAVASEPEADSGADSARGEATRPAADNISLDQVFGDSLPPSAAPAPPAAPAPSGPPSGGFSFDQFFSAGPDAGSGGATSSSSEGGAAPKAPARGSGPKARPPTEDEGDLDQFQAWLRGLKS